MYSLHKQKFNLMQMGNTGTKRWAKNVTLFDFLVALSFAYFNASYAMLGLMFTVLPTELLSGYSCLKYV